jgi:hypothetical protein
MRIADISEEDLILVGQLTGYNLPSIFPYFGILVMVFQKKKRMS